jgi:hypothetical protein
MKSEFSGQWEHTFIRFSQQTRYFNIFVQFILTETPNEECTLSQHSVQHTFTCSSVSNILSVPTAGGGGAKDSKRSSRTGV